MDIKSIRRILKERSREAKNTGVRQEISHLGIDIFCEPDGRIHGEDKKSGEIFKERDLVLEEVKARSG